MRPSAANRNLGNLKSLESTPVTPRGQNPLRPTPIPGGSKRLVSSPGSLENQNPAQELQETSLEDSRKIQEARIQPRTARTPESSPGGPGDQDPAQDASGGHQEALGTPKYWKFSSFCFAKEPALENFQDLGAPRPESSPDPKLQKRIRSRISSV